MTGHPFRYGFLTLALIITFHLSVFANIEWPPRETYLLTCGQVLVRPQKSPLGFTQYVPDFREQQLAAWRMGRSDAEGVHQALAIDESTDPDHIEILRALRKVGSHNIEDIRKDIDHIRELLLLLRDQPSLNKDEFDSRITALENFAHNLPMNIDDWKITGRHQFFNSQDPSKTRLYVQINNLQEAWVQFSTEQLRLQDLIREFVRAAPQALTQPPIQKALQTVLLDSLKNFYYQVAYADQGADKNFSLRSLFTFTLPAKHGIQSNFQSTSSSDLHIDTTLLIFVNLFREIIVNANEASQERHAHNSVSPPSWDQAFAHLEIQRDSEGNVHVIIRDYGDPQRYLQNHGTGVSATNNSSIGVGFGRYRIALLADFLGYTVTHYPLQDGSGSIVDVAIPKEKIRD